MCKVECAALQVVLYASGRTDDDLYPLLELLELGLVAGASVDGLHGDLPIPLERGDLVRDLHGKLPCWREHQGLGGPVLHIQLLKNRKRECGGLAGSGLCLSHYVDVPAQKEGDALPLDIGRLCEAFPLERLQSGRAQSQGLEGLQGIIFIHCTYFLACRWFFQISNRLNIYCLSQKLKA